MFSNVNEVVQHLHLAEQGNYSFGIDWSESSYRTESRAEDPWRYYFNDCFPDLEPVTDPIYLPRGADIACTKDNIITPRIEDKRCDPLLLPADRRVPHRIIRRYIQLKPHIRSIIDRFAAVNFQGYVVGLHIRGQGRTHGGVPDLRRRYGTDNRPPLDAFADAVEERLRAETNGHVFLCSDSADVVDQVREYFGRRLITYPASRSEFGEMHQVGHPKNKGLDFDRYKLGEDVVVEAYLLTRTNAFVHGNSNVSNFVLSANPHLGHTYVAA